MNAATDGGPERCEVLLQPYGHPEVETLVSFEVERVELSDGTWAERIVNLRAEDRGERR